MTTLLRRLRGILGTGALWGATGATVGSLVGTAVSVAPGVPLGFSLSVWGIGMSAVGLVLGCGFATVLAVFGAVFGAPASVTMDPRRPPSVEEMLRVFEGDRGRSPRRGAPP